VILLDARLKQQHQANSRKIPIHGKKTTSFQTSELTMIFLIPITMLMLLVPTVHLVTVDNHGLLLLKVTQIPDLLAILSNAKVALLHQKLLLHYGLFIMNQKKEKKRSNSKIGTPMKMKLIVIDT
jgi:hypothetical protein